MNTPPKSGMPGNKGESKGVEKKTKLVKSRSGQALLSVAQHTYQKPPDFGSVDPQELSPLRSSSNPTPEPGSLPTLKRPKLSVSSSSSSGSSSSDSESMEEDNQASHGHLVTTHKHAIPVARSIHASMHAEALRAGSVGSSSGITHSQKLSNVPNVYSQKHDSSQPLSRSSSAGRPTLSAVRVGLAQFIDEPSAKLLNQLSSAQEMEQSLSQPVGQGLSRGQTNLEDRAIPPSTEPSRSKQPASHLPISHQVIVSSSSSSDSDDSSSGSSSSDSSSDSNEENDKEVVSGLNRKISSTVFLEYQVSANTSNKRCVNS